MLFLKRTLPRMFHHYSGNLKRVAVYDGFGGSFNYENLYKDAITIKKEILKFSRSATVGFLAPNDSRYIKALFSIWASKRVGVPLCPVHPESLHRYFMTDSGADLLLTTKEFSEKGKTLCPGGTLVIDDILSSSAKRFDVFKEENNYEDGALLLYTSGTTGLPKGVWITHGNIRSQIKCMVDSWKWTEEDQILHILPLHHVHGIINCLLVPLSIGAKVEMLPKFDVSDTWKRLTDLSSNSNVFMAVPTVYSLLIKKSAEENEGSNCSERIEEVRNCLRSKFRLMVSGSAALPKPVLKKWKNISGHVLLERYGMTEIGMALTNPLDEDKRLAGYVGTPFPSVEARIVEEDGCVIGYSNGNGGFHYKSESSGELQIKGPNVFSKYFGKEKETSEAFNEQGWFLTGDIASMNAKGIFKILGRKSVDIIKSGGYKISALMVENEFLNHPKVSEISIVGVEDSVHGQVISAIVVPTCESCLDLNEV